MRHQNSYSNSTVHYFIFSWKCPPFWGFTWHRRASIHDIAKVHKAKQEEGSTILLPQNINGQIMRSNPLKKWVVHVLHTIYDASRSIDRNRFTRTRSFLWFARAHKYYLYPFVCLSSRYIGLGNLGLCLIGILGEVTSLTRWILPWSLCLRSNNNCSLLMIGLSNPASNAWPSQSQCRVPLSLPK